MKINTYESFEWKIDILEEVKLKLKTLFERQKKLIELYYKIKTTVVEKNIILFNLRESLHVIIQDYKELYL